MSVSVHVLELMCIFRVYLSYACDFSFEVIPMKTYDWDSLSLSQSSAYQLDSIPSCTHSLADSVAIKC